MSEHRTRLVWQGSDGPFTYETYSRTHIIHYPNGVTMTCSAASQYRGDASQVNPEDLLVAALSSCHMLTFLAIAARKGIAVTRYEDDAVGHLEKGDDGLTWVTRVTLRPHVSFDAEGVAPDQIHAMHQAAHRGCFIANSVKTKVEIEP